MKNNKYIQKITSESGGSLLEIALIAPVMILILGMAIDLGRLHTAAIEIRSAASAGAIYGTDSSSDITGIIAAAKKDASDLSSMSVSVAHGCECADGTGSVVNCTSLPSCAVNVVDYVQVTSQASITPLFHFAIVPSLYTVSSSVRMRGAHD